MLWWVKDAFKLSVSASKLVANNLNIYFSKDDLTKPYRT